MGDQPLLLVHGAWHGAWCWRPLQQRLDALGIVSSAIDLPGHGSRPRAPWRVRWQDYIDAVCNAALAFATPPIVVGHSMGGGIITSVAALAPDAFAAMIYVAAFVPQPGESILSLAKQNQPLEGVRLNLLRGHVSMRPEAARNTFFHDCPSADHWASQIQPQPIRPTMKPTTGAVTKTPRYYVQCLRDRAISPELQERMAMRAGIEQVHTLDCGHSPFLARTEQLAAIIAEIREVVQSA